MFPTWARTQTTHGSYSQQTDQEVLNSLWLLTAKERNILPYLTVNMILIYVRLFHVFPHSLQLLFEKKAEAAQKHRFEDSCTHP